MFLLAPPNSKGVSTRDDPVYRRMYISDYLLSRRAFAAKACDRNSGRIKQIICRWKSKSVKSNQSTRTSITYSSLLLELYPNVVLTGVTFGKVLQILACY